MGLCLVKGVEGDLGGGGVGGSLGGGGGSGGSPGGCVEIWGGPPKIFIFICVPPSLDFVHF